MTPAPYCPFSNGCAERGVASLKKILKKNNSGSLQNRLNNALLYYRTTPHSVTQVAPSVYLNGRKYITLKDRIHPNYFSESSKGGSKDTKSIKYFNNGDRVLALNMRSGPKWMQGRHFRFGSRWAIAPPRGAHTEVAWRGQIYSSRKLFAV